MKKIEAVLAEHKYHVSQYLKYHKLAQNYRKDSDQYKKCMEKAKANGDKAKELDYYVYLFSTPMGSEEFTLTEQAVKRWGDFIKQESDYRDKLYIKSISQGNKGVPLYDKNIRGLTENSLMRQSIIEVAINCWSCE